MEGEGCWLERRLRLRLAEGLACFWLAAAWGGYLNIETDKLVEQLG